jgi:hypothetical protein
MTRQVNFCFFPVFHKYVAMYNVSRSWDEATRTSLSFLPLTIPFLDCSSQESVFYLVISWFLALLSSRIHVKIPCNPGVDPALEATLHHKVSLFPQ